jgi:SHS2 domain-containing protein
VTKRVNVSADDYEGLLFEWLNELLYYFDVELLLFSGSTPEFPKQA